jgi:phage terminase large subunit
VFALEIQQAMNERRIGQVPRDRTRPVHTAWDLGFGDKTAIWFYQIMDGWYRLVDYLQDSGHTIEWYIIQIQQKGYLQGIDWLPHDAVDSIVHHKLGGGDNTRSIEMLMRAAGRHVRVAPKLRVADRINIARTLFAQCQFDQEKCAAGLQALRCYQWGPVNANNVTGREPLHDANSHGADAFQTFAVCAKQPVVRRQPALQGYEPPSGDRSWMS